MLIWFIYISNDGEKEGCWLALMHMATCDITCLFSHMTKACDLSRSEVFFWLGDQELQNVNKPDKKAGSHDGDWWFRYFSKKAAMMEVNGFVISAVCCLVL